MASSTVAALPKGFWLRPRLHKLPRSMKSVVKFILVVPFWTLVLFSMTALFASPIALVTWACIRYGNRAHDISQLCAARFSDNGFLGSPDFYSLGIRIGIYIQWLSSLVANLFFESECRGMAGAYVCFALALLIALLILVFQSNCTFTAEIIVLMYILWGGTYLVALPFLATDRARVLPKRLGGFTGLQWSVIIITFPLIPASA